MSVYERLNLALRKLESEERTLKDLLEEERGQPSSALFEHMIKGILENKILLDALLRFLSKLPLKKYRREEYYYLLIGAYGIVFLDKPDYALVSEIVTLMKKRSPHRAGAANAILRRLGREKERLMRDAAKQLPLPERLSIQYSVGKELTEMLLEQYAPQEVEAYFRYAQEKPALDLCVLGAEPEEYRRELSLAGLEALRLEGTHSGLRLSLLEQNVADLPGYAQGRFYVMGKASQLVCELIPQARSLLDLCAAPGGKSIGYKNRVPSVRLTCCDVEENRLRTLRENLQRVGMPAGIRKLDAAVYEPAFSERFDVVLLDAPCSASGLLARHPQLRTAIDRRRVERGALLQKALLEQAAKYVKKGGFLIYCTCSILSQEGIGQIDAFLRARNDFSLAAQPESKYADERGMFRTRPWVDDCDGFFAAAMQKDRT